MNLIYIITVNVYCGWSIKVNGSVCVWALFCLNVITKARAQLARETCNAGAPNTAHVSSMKPLKLILHANLRKNTSGTKCRPSRPANSRAPCIYKLKFIAAHQSSRAVMSLWEVSKTTQNFSNVLFKEILSYFNGALKEVILDRKLFFIHIKGWAYTSLIRT